jgi:hypothetical protein
MWRTLPASLLLILIALVGADLMPRQKLKTDNVTRLTDVEANAAAAAAAGAHGNARDAAAPAATTRAIPFVDVSLLNDEVDMLRYRIMLHAPFVSHFVVVECNRTFAGKPKPVLGDEVKQDILKLGKPYSSLNITVLQLPPVAAVYTKTHKFFEQEMASRLYITSWLNRTFPNHLVFFSDVDELLDAGALLRSGLMWQNDCIRPKIYNYYYGASCMLMGRDGSRSASASSLIFQTRSAFFSGLLANGFPARGKNPYIAHHCPIPNPPMGWHFSYAMNTEQILN